MARSTVTKFNPAQAGRHGGNNSNDYTFSLESTALANAIGEATLVAVGQTAKGGARFVVDYRLVRWNCDGEERYTAEWQIAFTCKGKRFASREWNEAERT